MERYEKLKKIGEGSFGKALLVRRKHDGRHCVVKEINISRMGAKEREESKKEVKVLSQLKHPNIVMYQESFEGMGNLYIVMDYCEGGDLYEKLVAQKGVNFSEGQVLDYFVQICLALKHIHDRKILHRDLKSQNIFLTKHGIVKLGDFGIARVLKSTVELARTCIGTPYYLSPEICENRPYNNKSDIWSLGCVLYELCTLKHAFEAGNMKNLVLKIIRGNHPPVPNRYSVDLRALVAHCFKRSPLERPSVNKILRKPLIQARIQKFLTPEAMEDEFSHTVLHKEKFGVQRQPVARPASAGVKKPSSAVAQVYGVSVARKPVVAASAAKRPAAGAVPSRRPVSAGRRPGPVVQQQKVIDDRRKDLDARERRRRNLVENQEQAYQDYLKNIHKQRYEKQQAQRMHRAREAGWKGLLQSDDAKDKKKNEVAAKQPNVLIKQQKPLEKYLPKGKPKVENQQEADIPEQKQIPPQQRQIPLQEKPFDAWVAAKQAREHGEMGADAAERARLIEDFQQRKREAAENKARGHYDYQPIANQQYKQPRQNEVRPNPVEQKPPRPPIAPYGVVAKNKEEKSYLEQLERIRRQNYQERKALQNKQPVSYEPPRSVSNRQNEKPHVGVDDPRYDPVARRQKITALKAQADERAAALREELNKRRRNLQQRLDDEKKEREKERQSKLNNKVERPIPAVENKLKNKEKVAVPAVGLETAMNQVAAARLFRSCSEGDLQLMVKKGQEMIHDRKHWNEGGPLGLAALPLEVTASAMEATSVNDAVYKPLVDESAHGRKNWGREGKTQLIFALENKALSNQTCMPLESPEKPGIGTTITLPKKTEIKDESTVGKTIVLPKKQSPRIGKTISLSVNKEAAEGQKSGKEPSAKEQTVKELKSPVDQRSSNIPDARQKIAGSAEIDSKENGEEKQAEDSENVSKNEEITALDDEVNDDDEDDIEELTVVAPTNFANQQKPKARSAWGAQGNAMFNFKENTIKTGEFGTKSGNIEPLDDKCAKSSEVIENEKTESKAENEDPQQELFKKTGGNKVREEKEDINLQDISADNDSFHTPNASLLETRKKGLNTGLYDSPSKVLRTTSLPELRMLSGSENEIDLDDNLESSGKGEHMSEKSVEKEDAENDEEADDFGDEANEDGDDNDEEDISDEDKSDEEMADYEHMLDSLRGVLSSADASPPSSAKVTRNDCNPFEQDKDQSRSSSSASKSIEDNWDSDDDDDDESEAVIGATNENSKGMTRTEKRTKARETLFQRIEESRKELEDELGTARFLKVYRYIQAMQENDDDEMDVDPTKDPAIRDILDGENEHLYQRILYLVLADAAYFEDNE